MNREIAVGIVFFVGLLLLAYFTIVVEDIGGLAYRTPGKPDTGVVYKVRFDSVAGLESGMKVKASGMDVGKVKSLRLLPDGKVEATLAVWEKIPFFADYKVVVKDVSPLGGKYVDIEPGDAAKPPVEPDKSELKGQARSNVLAEGGALVADIREDVKRMFDNLRQITESIREGQGTLGRLYKDAKLYDDLAATVKELRTFAGKLNSAEGTLGKLLSEREMYDRLLAAAKQLESVLSGVNEGKGTVGKLFQDQGLHDELKDTVKRLRAFLDNASELVSGIRSGQGTLGQLYVNRELYDSVTGAAKEAREVLASLRAGKGTLGKLLTDEALYTSLRGVAADLQGITADLRRGKGTLGKLLKDESLYNDMKNVVTELGKAIEDQREQAPITTFTNVIFNVF